MTSEVGTDLRAVQLFGVPCLQVYRVRKRSMSAGVACLQTFHVPLRWSFQRNRPIWKTARGILSQEEFCWISPAGCVVFR